MDNFLPLVSKENNTGELIVSLFELCNLACPMCPQNHNDKSNLDTVLNKIPNIKLSLDALKKKGKTSVSINLMGGELLLDELPDQIFLDYGILINEIRQYGKIINLQVDIRISSNMIWNNLDRVRSLLKQTNINLNASYDPSGRFNTSTFEIFKKNILEFKTSIHSVGTVMTLSSIKKFIDKDVPFFDYLYENFEIIFDHYTPEFGGVVNLKERITDVLMPADQDLKDFYKFMIANYPNCLPFRDMKKKGFQPMSCMGTITIFPESQIQSCDIYQIPTVKSEQKITFFGKLNEQKLEFINDYDCLGCHHLDRCQMGCFLNHHNHNIRTQENCWLQEVYDYIDNI